MKTMTMREVFFSNALKIDKSKRIEDFFVILEQYLGNEQPEIKLPMQLFEMTFEFDFHRGVKHPISSNIIDLFKNKGFKVSKVRNNYLVRFRKIQE